MRGLCMKTSIAFFTSLFIATTGGLMNSRSFSSLTPQRPTTSLMRSTMSSTWSSLKKPSDMSLASGKTSSSSSFGLLPQQNMPCSPLPPSGARNFCGGPLASASCSGSEAFCAGSTQGSNGWTDCVISDGGVIPCVASTTAATALCFNISASASFSCSFMTFTTSATVAFQSGTGARCTASDLKILFGPATEELSKLEGGAAPCSPSIPLFFALNNSSASAARTQTQPLSHLIRVYFRLARPVIMKVSFSRSTEPSSLSPKYLRVMKRSTLVSLPIFFSTRSTDILSLLCSPSKRKQRLPSTARSSSSMKLMGRGVRQ
mmetsp:Transcript_91078/g.175335  ORF Transcript_91078/g.175335 Transcript_91078/m.175335 type:complete len:318 (+) Transcript_91078:597-1550(+)